ncbi:EhaF family protein [Methanobrevibacter millerae]|uniref:Energy-converting hydrogenase A subunit F n=1 Tax=Methanobrevibacter millerae TaxID=230361 RepID=A0A1G5VTE8_9EURY|nr:EhaF family protein [Methanobrevibacter millerae]SDA48295.1 energy-converting hydrogenase A subunit F [Methanobrevibacter millerae]
MKIGKIWNKLADPKNVPRLFAFCLGVILIIGFVVPMALNPDQIYTRPAPQVQADEGLALAPYDRGGEVLKEPGIIKAQYPENSKELGMITGYMSPLAEWVSSISPYFGTSIYSSPGGLIDEVLYYTRGFDTILESSILMMAFIIASWLTINYTMKRRDIEKDLKKAADDSARVAREVKLSDEKARAKQLRRDN